MSPAERVFWRRVQRQISFTQGKLSAETLRAIERLVEDMPSTPRLAELIRAGNVDAVIESVLADPKLRQAFGPVREELREAVRRAALNAETTMPRFRPPTPPGQGAIVSGFGQPNIGTRFDLLNPEVAKAVQDLESRSLERMGTEMREAVRQTVARGLQEGVNPTTLARKLRDVIGLTPRQEQIVANYRAELEGTRDGNPLDRALRDKRFDRTVARGNLTPDQIDRMTEAYRSRMLTNTASLNARTVAAEAQRVGQRASWEQAIADGTGGTQVLKRWVHSGVPIEPRPEHLALDWTEVPFDERYPNGDMYPGEHDPWNCRCVETYRVVRAALAA